MAKRYWPAVDPLGKHISIPKLNPASREIIGIVADVRHTAVDREALPEMYVPTLLSPSRAYDVVVRSLAPQQSLINSVRDEFRSLDPSLPIFTIRSMNETVDRNLASRRFSVLLLGIFAMLALMLAAVGIYGVMSYLVRQRTREIGLRMALGAQTGDVLKLVLRQGLKLVIAGIVVGLLGALASARVLASLLFGVSATDPATLAIVATTLTLVAMLACYVPAYRAAKIDPMAALRNE
jgi:putative ABC transport system permease protein